MRYLLFVLVITFSNAKANYKECKQDYAYDHDTGKCEKINYEIDHDLAKILEGEIFFSSIR